MLQYRCVYHIHNVHTYIIYHRQGPQGQQTDNDNKTAHLLNTQNEFTKSYQILENWNVWDQKR